MKSVLAAGIALTLTVQAPVARPRILGIAHLAVFVSDLTAARGFYRDLLGFDESFTLPKPDGSVDVAFVKINDRQWIELINRPTGGEGQLDHVALSTDGAERMRDYLASRGVQVPEKVGVGPTGDKSFTITDPDGHRVEIVEYQRDSRTGKDAGTHLPATRIAERALHVGILVGELARATEFYTRHPRIRRVLARQRREVGDAELGEHEGARRHRLPRVHALRPEAAARSPRHPHHLCLLVPDAEKAVAALESRPGAQGLHPRDRSPDRHQPEAAGQPVRSRRHACGTDGAGHRGREAGARINPPATALGREFSARLHARPGCLGAPQGRLCG